MFTRLIKERHSDGKIKEIELLFDGKPIPDTHKYCPSCEQLLDKSFFSSKGNVCKPCAIERSKKWRVSKLENPNWRKERNQQIKENGRKRKRELVSLMGDKCFDCHQQFPDYVYDFHHLNPKEKDFTIAKFRSISKIKEELKKCVMLCSNCHRIRHFNDK